ncbi:Iron-sulfur cluster biosynthesis family protein [Heracleum sosnowskyi]|uniref:Iron-sulfur cluster biosynthesis family protein n=1 Tax=Heracleum sosnowskyi TaxID=360622 RepID=A0AAD8ISI8_9APIA|nr:Iron-sulfur cluster biosynthesis family protein [Heracleum sosnowskyi]
MLQKRRLSSYAPVIKATTDAFYSIETDKLPSDVRNRTLEAVDSCGRKVTVGDVAGKAGIKVDEAQKALQAVAADSDGYLDVSDEGDVLYVFPEDYRSKLTAKSIRIRYEPLVEKTKSVADRVVRFAFGAALIVSIVLVFAAIVVILVSKSDEDDDKKSKSKSSSSNLFFLDSSPNSFRWLDAHVPQVESNGMDFTEAVFSFVFGDGDPNQNFEEKRWKLIGQYIASIGGVTTAEELAPYLDVKTKAQKNDEGYILPVLIRFDGQPEVDEEGNILYQFPSLQRTASPDRRGKGHRDGIDKVVPNEKFLRENYWNFSNTTMYQKVMVVGLAILNNLGVFILGGLLRDKEVTKIGFIKFVSYTYPLLQIYAVSYFVIPFFRGIFILKINADIKKRNQAREQHALGLELPDVSLRRKLQNARDLAKKNFVGNDKVVYSTKGDLVDQSLEADEWDQKLSRGRKSKVKKISKIAKRKSIGNKNVIYSFGQDIDVKESGKKLLEMTEEFEKTD